MLENCVFYISLMYEFLHSQGQSRRAILAAKIANELRNKRPEHFVDKLSLADIHSSLERAGDVLSTVNGSQAQGLSATDN